MEGGAQREEGQPKGIWFEGRFLLTRYRGGKDEEGGAAARMCSARTQTLEDVRSVLEVVSGQRALAAVMVA